MSHHAHDAAITRALASTIGSRITVRLEPSLRQAESLRTGATMTRSPDRRRTQSPSAPPTADAWPEHHDPDGDPA